MKIFLGLSEISGMFSRLKTGLEALGHEVDFINVNPHQFGYDGAVPLPEALLKIVEAENVRYGLRQYIGSIRKKKSVFFHPRFWVNGFRYVVKTIENIAQFIIYFKQYDSVVFIFGSSFFLSRGLVHFNDLFWLRLIRVKTIFLMCGSDSRPAFVDGAILGTLSEINADTVINTSLATERNNQFMEKYAYRIISNVFSSYFLKKPIVPIQAIGHAAIIMENDAVENVDAAGCLDLIKVLHAPSIKDAKGTSEIQRVVDELVAEGYHIHLQVISGVTNQVVIHEIKKCDFVIDQLYSDYPLAGFATEAACFKKPAIVGSYITQDEFAKASEVLGVPPSLICHPTNLREAILKLVVDKQYRLDLGDAAYHYVTQVLHPTRVAQRYVDLMNNNYPKSGLLDPQKFITAIPVCMSRERMTSVMRLLPNMKKLSATLQHLVNEGLT